LDFKGFKLKISINNFWLGLSSGHYRSVKAKKNILFSVVSKVGNMAVSFALVPLTIDYLNPTKYGIWITLSSIIGWFSFFDIGLGNGLRYHLAEAWAKGEIEKAKTYVSTTYAILSIIVLGMLTIFFIVNPFLDWRNILNLPNDVSLFKEIGTVVLVVFSFFCVGFIIRLITTILKADQNSAKASSFDFIAQALSLLLIYLLTKVSSGSLTLLSLTLSVVPIFVLIVASAILYSGKYRSIRPSYKYIDLSKKGELLNLGIKFFVIQIAAVILYQTNNIIISQLFGPAEVTPYNLAFKLFSLVPIGFTIVQAALWSAFTEAWAKGEKVWIQQTMGKLIKTWGGLVFLAFLILMNSGWLYKLWIGGKIEVSFNISFMVFLWVILNTWNGLYSTFLNGIGKVKLQLIIGVSAAALNIPLALFLGDLMGIEGVLFANVILAFLASLLYPMQYKKILNGTAKGLMNS
jgi:O-antigen/teichoic acid export membrane protein